METNIYISVRSATDAAALLDRLVTKPPAAAAAESAAAAPPKAQTPQPNERYAGIAFNEHGEPSHHLFLLAAKPDKKLSWAGAQAWAKTVHGDVPTRFESALLYANLRDQFNPEGWYWTSTQYSAGYAWCQDFGYGNQDHNDKSYEAQARAVRRLPL